MTARRIILVVLVTLALAAAAVAYQFDFGRSKPRSGTVRVSGNIELIDVEVSFKIPGRVEERPVDEGEWVEPGKLLAKLDPRDLKADVDLRRAEVQAAEAALVELENGSRPEEIAAALAAKERAQAALDELLHGSRPQEIAVAQAAVTSAQVEQTRLKTERTRAEGLYRARTISREEYDRQVAAYDVSVARLAEANERLALVKEGPRREQIEAAKAALAQAQSQYDLVKRGPREEVKKQAAAKLAQAKAGLELAEIRLSYATLYWHLPWTGVVMSKNVEPKEYVSAGTPIITVGDIKHVWLRAYISAEDQGPVKYGQKVRVTTDAYPGKVYDGVVAFIAPEAEFTPKSVQTPKERTKLVYRVKINIDNPNMELKRGMPADGEILLGTEPSVTSDPAKP